MNSKETILFGCIWILICLNPREAPSQNIYNVFATQYAAHTNWEVALPYVPLKVKGKNLRSAYWIKIQRPDQNIAINVPVREVGPWNERDDYWEQASSKTIYQYLEKYWQKNNSPLSPLPPAWDPRLFPVPPLDTQIEPGIPEAWQAYKTSEPYTSSTYNYGCDQFGRHRWYTPAILNGAGVDLSEGVREALGLAYLQNAWVNVTFFSEPPLVTRVIITQQSNTIYDSQTKISNPAIPGLIVIKIIFNETMKTENLPVVAFGRNSFNYNTYSVINGIWSMTIYENDTWTGTATIDSGAATGQYTLSITATDLGDNQIDKDEDSSNGYQAGKDSLHKFTIQAQITECTFTLTTKINPAGSGTVTKNPDKPTYCSGESVTLTAMGAPNSGYGFKSWSGVDSSNGTTATVTMSKNRTVTANFVKASKTLSNVTVTPSSWTFSSSGTKQLTATATYSDNTTQDVTTNAIWISSNSNVATVNNSGLVTSGQNGSAVITATYGGKSGTCSVTINIPQTGTLSVTTTPVSGAIYVDDSYKGTGSWNGTLNVGSHKVSFGDISGYITPSPQTVTVIANQTISVTGAYVQQNQPPVINGLTANPPTVSPGGSSTISVSASDPEGDPLTYTWSASGGTLSSTTGQGPITWIAPSTSGTYTVTVSVTDNKPGHSPVSKSVQVTVTPQLLPPPALLSPGSGSGPGPSISTTTPTFQWQAVSGASRYGLYISQSPYGQANLVYQNENISGSATSFTLPSGLQNGGQYRWNMTTFNSAGQNGDFASPLYFVVSVSKTVSSVTVNPSSWTFTSSGNTQLTATATYTDNSTEDVTTKATWTSSNSNVATVSNSGLVTSGQNGSATITATYGGKSGTCNISVNTVNTVTLTLYVHDGSASGPILAGAQVTGSDGAGATFNSTTNSSGYVAITGASGTWQFSISKTGYNTNSWGQSITATETLHAFLTVNTILNWRNIGPVGGGEIQCVAIDPSNPSIVYAGSDRSGVFKTTNGGTNWTAINSGLPRNDVSGYWDYVNALAIDPSNTSILYAGTAWNYGGGVFKTNNGGADWTAINSGLVNSSGGPLYVYALAIDPSNTSIIYAGTNRGVFKTTNGGTDWSAINTGLPIPTNGYFSVDLLVIDPSNTSILYVGSYGAGVFKSTDGGGSWSASNNGLAHAILALVIDPSNTSILYAGTSGGGVIKTTNGGADWTAINSGLTNPSGQVFALAIDPSNTSILYVGSYGAGVFKSTDGGASWTPINTGLDTSPSANLLVSALAIDPKKTSTVYAGTQYGVFKLGQ